MVHTRSTDSSPFVLDPEIEKTLRSVRRTARTLFPEQEEEMTDEEPKRVTLESLTAPNLEQQTNAVTFPALPSGTRFELKTGVVQLLPKFSGLATEDPIQHLDEFLEVCASMKPSDITDDQMRLRVFAFSLKDLARDWYHSLAPGSVTTWVELKKAFLQKFFPAIKSNQLKKKICNIEQYADETLYDYFERFKKLIKMCPYHGYENHDLILYLHGGLKDEDRRMINSACGGNILKFTYEEGMQIFATLADDSRQYNSRTNRRSVAEMGKVDQDEFALLKEEVRRLKLKGTPQQAKACEICHDDLHPTDACPTLQEQVNAVGGFQPRPRYDPYANQYNPGWRDHPNFRWRDQEQQQQPPQQQGPPRQFVPRPQAPIQGAPNQLEDMMRTLMQSNVVMNENIAKLSACTLQLQESTKASVQNLEKQIGQLSQAVGHVQAQISGRLPSQTEKNPEIKNVSCLNVQKIEEDEQKLLTAPAV